MTIADSSVGEYTPIGVPADVNTDTGLAETLPCVLFAPGVVPFRETCAGMSRGKISEVGFFERLKGGNLGETACKGRQNPDGMSAGTEDGQTEGS